MMYGALELNYRGKERRIGEKCFVVCGKGSYNLKDHENNGVAPRFFFVDPELEGGDITPGEGGPFFLLLLGKETGLKG